jgi:hypothetical protein
MSTVLERFNAQGGSSRHSRLLKELESHPADDDEVVRAQRRLMKIRSQLPDARAQLERFQTEERKKALMFERAQEAAIEKETKSLRNKFFSGGGPKWIPESSTERQ